MADLKEMQDRIVSAQRQVFDGRLALWNARIEAALASGDEKAALNQLGAEVLEANNCGCNNGCDAQALRGAERGGLLR